MNLPSESPVEMPADLSLDMTAEVPGDMHGPLSDAAAEIAEQGRVEETITERPFELPVIAASSPGDESAAADVSPLADAPDERSTDGVVEPGPAAPSAAAEQETPDPAAENAMEIALPAALALELAPAGLAQSLVALRRVAGQATTSYERIAGKIMMKSWNRTSLFFTSAQAAEGSTEAAVNLATMISRGTESTLLVDMQLTEPAIWALLGRPEIKVGFEEALRGRASFEACVHEIAGEKLEVLLLKRAMTTEEAAHCSGALNDFLEWAEERFAWIIVDCPPVLAPAWTRWFELNADPAVLVVRGGKTTKHELHTVVRRLGDRLAGTIMSSTEEGKQPEKASVSGPRLENVFQSQLRASGTRRR